MFISGLIWFLFPKPVFLAGRAGFEPAAEFNPSTHLAGEPNRPLWHLPELLSLPSIPLPEAIPAEGVGFEPTMGFPIPVFKTGALGRSAIPPKGSGASHMLAR